LVEKEYIASLNHLYNFIAPLAAYGRGVGGIYTTDLDAPYCTGVL